MAEIIIDGEVFKLSCGMSDCKNGMHTFRPTRKSKSQNIKEGSCTQCKTSLVNWDRVYKRDINDFDYTKKAFQFEMIRNVFWNIKKPTNEMISKIKELNSDQLAQKVHSRLKATLNKPKSENDWDGRQTKLESDNLIYWAQHATGTCCRKCLEYLHGIDANSQMTDEYYNYLQKVILAYLDEKTK